MLISTLNWPSSVWKSALVRRSRTSALRRAGRDVHLDVVGTELGLEGRIGDLLEDGHVAQERLPVGPDQVELDLEPGQRVVAVALERGRREHALEDVQAQLDLLAVALPFLAGVMTGGDLIAHLMTKAHRRRGGQTCFAP